MDDRLLNHPWPKDAAWFLSWALLLLLIVMKQNLYRDDTEQLVSKWILPSWRNGVPSPSETLRIKYHLSWCLRHELTDPAIRLVTRNNTSEATGERVISEIRSWFVSLATPMVTTKDSLGREREGCNRGRETERECSFTAAFPSHTANWFPGSLLPSLCVINCRVSVQFVSIFPTLSSKPATTTTRNVSWLLRWNSGSAEIG